MSDVEDIRTNSCLCGSAGAAASAAARAGQRQSAGGTSIPPLHGGPDAPLPLDHLGRKQTDLLLVQRGRSSRHDARPCNGRAPTICGCPVIGTMVAEWRRWTAIATLRLSSQTLRCAIALHSKQAISRKFLLVLLSATRMLERIGARLVLGGRRPRHLERNGSDDCNPRVPGHSFRTRPRANSDSSGTEASWGPSA